MTTRPSEPLLHLLREAAQKKGLNTAALAESVGLERGALKQILGGQTDLTVDLLVLLSEALELGAEDLAEMGLHNLNTPAPALERVPDLAGFRPPVLDPYGNHGEQILKLGFALGCDMHMVLRTSKLEGSGIPEKVLAQYETQLPLRLDAAFHKHNDPRFLPDALQIVLSFDALHTCTFSWDSFVQVTLFPLPSDPDEDPPSDGPHLRLVD